jgi:hypothetical protein
LAEQLNAPLLRETAYLLAALIAFWAWDRERSAVAGESDAAKWPRFWLTVAILMACFFLMRAFSVHELVTSLGREQAHSGGWYEARRSFQAAAVASIFLAWFVTVGIATWRIPERRRRYLPPFAVVTGISCFAAIRTVSIHHIDTVLYRLPVYGVHLVVVFELVPIALLCAIALRHAGSAAPVSTLASARDL